MLQRIQTIYIIIFTALLFIGSLCSFANLILEDKTILKLFPTGWEYSSGEKEKSLYFLGYLVAASFGILMLVNFKKRTKQLKYGKVCYLVVLITLLYMFTIVDNKIELLDPSNNLYSYVTYSYSMYFLVASLPFIFLANRAIKKDENLIKSLDRLR